MHTGRGSPLSDRKEQGKRPGVAFACAKGVEPDTTRAPKGPKRGTKPLRVSKEGGPGASTLGSDVARGANFLGSVLG